MKLLKAKLRYRDVMVSETGETVRVQAMSNRIRVNLLDVMLNNEADADAYEADKELPDNERKNLPPVKRFDQVIVTLIHSIVNEAGRLEYTMADYASFEDLSYQTTSALWMATRELNDFQPASILLEKKAFD